MKTLNHTISFPSAVGELVVQYNFTEAEIHGKMSDPYVNVTPAEVEITSVKYRIGCVDYTIDHWNYEIKRNHSIQQAVYEAHMKQLKEKEDAEAERKDGYPRELTQQEKATFNAAAEKVTKTSTLHEHAKQMWKLGQELFKEHKRQNPMTPGECTGELDLTITEPEEAYPYSAEIPAAVRQNGLYIQMPVGEQIPDHILQAGNHLEQPPIKDIQDFI